MLVKRSRPKITAKQVAERLGGGYKASTVSSGRGIFKSLTRHRAPGARGKLFFNADEVDALIQPCPDSSENLWR
jgi:hypothetical protein